MAICDVCGNDYEPALQITQGARSGTFDSFECAEAAMAPQCASCGVRIVGHGTTRGEAVYCSNPCAERGG